MISVDSVSGFTMVVFEKIFGSINNNQYISLKNNTAQLYFTLETAKLHWKFATMTKDGSDIHKYSNNNVAQFCSKCFLEDHHFKTLDRIH